MCTQVLGRSFTPLDAQDPYQKKKTPPALETRGCRFTRFQEARLQESVDEVGCAHTRACRPAAPVAWRWAPRGGAGTALRVTVKGSVDERAMDVHARALSKARCSCGSGK